MNERTRKLMVFLTWNAFIPLVAGTFIYVILRPDALITIIINRILGNHNVVQFSINQSYKNTLIIIIRNHLADGLWAYSTAILLLCMGSFQKRNIKNILILCILMDVGMEIQQIVNPYFTFDFIDLIVELLFTALAWLAFCRFSKIVERRNQNESE